MTLIRNWFRRFLTDPQAVVLMILLAMAAFVILFLGKMLAPVLAALVIAYLLEGPIRFLQRWGLSRLAAVFIVCALATIFVLFTLLEIIPLLSRQLTQLVQLLPSVIVRGQELLLSLPARYPEHFNESQVLEVMVLVRAEMGKFAQTILSLSLASIVGLITLAIYLFLVPLLVFFLLKDKKRILTWFSDFLPHGHTLVQEIWREVDRQLGNYVRGKFLEICIVWAASYLAFTLLGLQFAILLGLMVGLSVILPFIGAALASLPVAIVAFLQWGWGGDFVWVMAVYGVIQLLDGNVLSPVLFSEAVGLHPVAIIVAVLVCGGLWGFWGLFFAVPLATLVEVLIAAWPRRTFLKAPSF